MDAVVRMFQEGGFAMYPLLLCSILVVAVAIQRSITLAKARVDPYTFSTELRRVLVSEGLQQGAAYCRAYDTPVSRVCLTAILQHDRKRQDLEATLSNSVKVEGSRLGSTLSTIGTIGALAPFIGLFGTVIAIRGSIREISLTQRAGTAEIYGHIGEALVATAAGLLVGIAAVFIYNWLTNWVESFDVDMQVAANEMIYVVKEALPGSDVGEEVV